MDHEHEKRSDAQSSDHRYLAQLEFNPELRKTWLNFFVTNFRVVVLLIILISSWGIYAFNTLPRESNPEVKIPIAVVSVVYPGASPADVEELVTKKLETAISGLPGLNKLTSNSANSLSVITVEFDPKQDLDDSIRKLRDKVTSVHDFPAEVKDPVVTEVSVDDTPILTLVLTGPYDGFTLRTYGERVQDEIKKLPGVRDVNISGGDQREFSVAYDPSKLLFYGISADQGNAAIAATNVAVPGGNFKGDQFTYPVRSDARFFDETSLGAIPISHDDRGGVIFLKDIASVQERAIEKTVYSRFSIKSSKPQSSVTLNIVKRTGGNVLETVDTAMKITDDLVKTFPPGITYDKTLDFAENIRHDFDQLTHDFIFTLLLVFGILFLIVGLKEAFVAGLAIPLVFFFTFGIMQTTGTSLNNLSLFSLLLSLGLLVDDAIVVVSATKQYLRTGKYTPEEAVLLVLNDFKVVLTTTTLTTVWAFLPLLFSTGIIGEYIKSIPITVTVTLMSSLFIALMINHPLAAVLERIRLTRKIFFLIEFAVLGVVGASLFMGTIPTYVVAMIALVLEGWLLVWYERGGRETLVANETLVEQEWQDDELIKQKLRKQAEPHHENFMNRLIHGILDFHKVLPWYEHYLKEIISSKRRRFWALTATAAIFVAAVLLPVTGIVRSEFFPSSNQNLVFINIRATTGLRLEETDAIVATVEQQMLTYPEVANFSTIVGGTGPNVQRFGDAGQNQSNLAGITVRLVDEENRRLTSDEMADTFRKDLKNIKGATISVASLSGGPPAGAAFEAQIKGGNLDTLTSIAHDLSGVLSSITGIVNVDISLKDVPPEYTFAFDPVKLEQNFLNAGYAGSMLRMAISGIDVTTVIRDNKEIKVVARFSQDKIPSLEALQNLQILNLRKQPVFLKDVATIDLRPSVNSITRVDQKRTVLLSAGVSGNLTGNDAVAEFQKLVAANYHLPSGYEITYGGENEQNAQSVASIIRAMFIAVILILSTLVIQFNSFKKAFIVLVTLPLALIGVFVGLAIFQVPLSFPGLIGILALFGIVVKNAIILMDKINLNIRSGIPFFEAIVDAGKSRLEAIFITSICTIAGIIPVTLSNALWTALGSAIIFGLALSSFLTLFILPTLFLVVIDEKERF